MNLKFNIPVEMVLALDEVDALLMVCSHERSGTHFLMNSLASCTRYVGNPWLNYDLMPLGGSVNFFSDVSVADFFNRIAQVQAQGAENMRIASIVKSHFPLSLVQSALHERLKVAYIYRNPVDTLVSFWKLLHSFNWFEGPKTDTPLALAMHAPCGQTQRYQVQNCETYFDRWALHVTDAVRVAAQSRHVKLIAYEDLVRDHAARIEALADALHVPLTGRPVYPSRQKDVITGSDMRVSGDDRQRLKDFCLERAGRYPDLPKGILDHF